MANIVGTLAPSPLAATNFAEPFLTAMLLMNGIMLGKHKIRWSPRPCRNVFP